MAGDEPSTADTLAPLLIDRTIATAEVSATSGLVVHLEEGRSLIAPPDEDFEAWNVVGPQGQRTISIPGSELKVEVFRALCSGRLLTSDVLSTQVEVSPGATVLVAGTTLLSNHVQVVTSWN